MVAIGWLCMHELYRALSRWRPLPVVGFASLAGMVIAARYGGLKDVMEVAVATLPVLFLFALGRGGKGPADDHDRRDAAGDLLARPRVRARGSSPGPAARQRGPDRRARRHVPGRYRRLRRRAPVRPPCAGARDLAQQDGRGAVLRDADRDRVGVPGRSEPDLAHARRRAAAGCGGCGPRADRRPVRIRDQARRRDQGRGQRVRRPRRRAGSPRRGDLHGRRGLLHLGRCDATGSRDARGRTAGSWTRG